MEIQSTKEEMIDEQLEYPSSSPYWSGRALSLKLKASRLDRLSQLLRECTWQRAGALDAHAEAIQNCQSLVESINTQITDLHRKWLVELDDNPQNQLKHFLMRQDYLTPVTGVEQQILVCNVDTNLLSLCEEARFWLDLKYQLPQTIQQISGRWRSLQFIYENVLAIVATYNKIVEGKSLNLLFNFLFKVSMQEKEEKIINF